MQRTLRQLITESRILKSVLIFFLAYFILSVLWIQIKDGYGYGITFVASKFVAGVKDARLEDLAREGNFLVASFSSMKGGKNGSVNVEVKVSPFSYSFNVPLILSILLSLYPFIKRRKRAYAEALLIIVIFHLLHVFFFGTLKLTNVFMIRGIEKVSVIRLSLYEFLWGVTDYSAISFAPFLIVVYTFVRFRR